MVKFTFGHILKCRNVDLIPDTVHSLTLEHIKVLLWQVISNMVISAIIKAMTKCFG